MTTIGSQLLDAATLMMTGMAVVFIFLTILVYLVKLMSKLVPSDLPPETTPAIKHSATKSAHTVDPKVVAAISAAIHQHRAATAK
ncbi:oxaloacetate decarboxylase subunit gamma [Vibrio sp. WXL103]|uniref:oxaloacetate decarboxylase subunit gamma n=1 Tax=unclassified Vibrio TaxID=2614977 RepID=UPI003EC7C4D0